MLGACKKAFQYSLLEVRPLATDLNIKAIQQIGQQKQKDTFTFLVISDTQIALDELEDFVDHANKKYKQEDLAFVLHGGDITDFGANYEYNHYYREIKKIHFPVVSTIGNHDMLGNGTEIFKKFMGPENFTFTYGNAKFVIFNSNSRERGFDGTLPNVDWVAQQIAASQTVGIENLFYLSHVSPFASDYDPQKIEQYTQLIADHPKTKLSIHGHTHNYIFDQPYGDGVDYLVAPSLEKRSYVEVQVNQQSVTVKSISY